MHYYSPPSPVELDGFRRFLLKDATAVFDTDAGPGRVFDHFADVYDSYPRYGRLRDIQGKRLVLGDRYFRLADMALRFLAATQLGHDPYGILGEKRRSESVSLLSLEMTSAEFDAFLQQMGSIVQEIDSRCLIEIDWMLLLNRGPSISAPVATPVAKMHRSPTDIVATRDMGLTTIALMRDGDGLVLDIEGERTPVSKAEAEVFLNRSDDRLLDWALGPEVDREARLGELVSRGLRTELEYVYMDQSSFRNALAALDHDAITPTGLFDLSALAHHLVFADAIAVPSTCVVPEPLQGIVVTSEVGEGRLVPALHAMADANGFRTDSAAEVDGLLQVEAAWREFLGVEVVLNYGHVDSATSSPGSWEYVIGDFDWTPDPAEMLLMGTGTQDLSQAVSIHTLRYIVNERRAALMGVPYVTSALRYPVQAVRMRNSLHFSSVIEHLHSRRGATLEEARGSTLHHVQVPDALGVACSGAGDRSDILPQVLELRGAMTAFREAVRTAREGGRSDSDIVRELRQRIPEMKIARTVDALIAQVSSAAVTTGADLGIGLLGIKLAGPLGLAQRGSRLMDTILRPQIRVLQRFTRRATEGATVEDVARLWDMKTGRLNRPWFSLATLLSDISAYESAKLVRF